MNKFIITSFFLVCALAPSFGWVEGCDSVCYGKMPNDYDKLIIGKIIKCDKEIQHIERMLDHFILFDMNDPEIMLIYLKGKRDAYNEFLYELD